MYLHAGNNTIIRTKSIIGIFDMDNATRGADTKKFLKKCQENGELFVSKEEIPKSFILYGEKKKKNFVCISQLSSSAVKGRSEIKNHHIQHI